MWFSPPRGPKSLKRKTALDGASKILPRSNGSSGFFLRALSYIFRSFGLIQSLKYYLLDLGRVDHH